MAPPLPISSNASVSTPALSPYPPASSRPRPQNSGDRFHRRVRSDAPAHSRTVSVVTDQDAPALGLDAVENIVAPLQPKSAHLEKELRAPRRRGLNVGVRHVRTRRCRPPVKRARVSTISSATQAGVNRCAAGPSAPARIWSRSSSDMPGITTEHLMCGAVLDEIANEASS